MFLIVMHSFTIVKTKNPSIGPFNDFKTILDAVCPYRWRRCGHHVSSGDFRGYNSLVQWSDHAKNRGYCFAQNHDYANKRYQNQAELLRLLPLGNRRRLFEGIGDDAGAQAHYGAVWRGQKRIHQERGKISTLEIPWSNFSHCRGTALMAFTISTIFWPAKSVRQSFCIFCIPSEPRPTTRWVTSDLEKERPSVRIKGFG